VVVTVDGELISAARRVQVRKQPKPGLAVAEDAGCLLAVTTELTDRLRWEGLRAGRPQYPGTALVA
jgi:hypothetical protein